MDLSLTEIYVVLLCLLFDIVLFVFAIIHRPNRHLHPPTNPKHQKYCRASKMGMLVFVSIVCSYQRRHLYIIQAILRFPLAS